MLVYSFEVGDDSDASTPGTEHMGSFTVTQIYRTNEASFATGRSNHDPRTPAFPEIKTLYLEDFIYQTVGHSPPDPSSPSPVESLPSLLLLHFGVSSTVCASVGILLFPLTLGPSRL